MSVKIVEIQQTLAADGTMTLTLRTASGGKSTDAMLLCSARAGNYSELGETVRKSVIWANTTASADFTAEERAKFTDELFVLIDSGTGESHDLSNICCIYLDAPVLAFYRVTEWNELLLYPDRSKRDTQLATDMRCRFVQVGTAISSVLDWHARLEIYGLHASPSAEITLSYSHTDKVANAEVYGPSVTHTVLIAPPEIQSISCTAQSGTTSADLTAVADGALPARLQATLDTGGGVAAEKELSNNGGSYVWTGLPALDPSAAYTVSFRAKCDLGCSKPSRAFPLLYTPPVAEGCTYEGNGVTIQMAAAAAYEVTIGATPAIHAGKAIILTPVPGTSPVIRFTRDASFGPALTCTLSAPAYYRFSKDTAFFYQYGTKPAKDSGADLKLTAAVSLPAYSGAFFQTNGTEIAIKVSAFADTADIRAVHADYIGLLAACTDSAQVLAIRAALLGGMPMRAADMLFYHYHHQPESGYTDLLPGMALEVSYAGFQYIPDDLRRNPAAWDGEGEPAGDIDLNGYVGAGSETISLVERSGKLRFEPFVSSLVDSGWLIVPTPEEMTDQNTLCGGAGVLDLLFAGLKAPLLRLVYPQTATARNSAGSLKFYENICLMAADTTALLDEAAGRMVRWVTGAGAGAFVPGVGITGFRGRAVVVPKVSMAVNGVPRLVSVGTLLGDVTAEHGATTAVLWRQGPEGLCPVPQAGADMPLLAGDSVNIL